jgi:hypothetical protein
VKRILLIVALLLPFAARAYDCFPSQFTFSPATGTAYRTVSSAWGEIDVWWCHLPTRQGDLPTKWYWQAQRFPIPNKCKDYRVFATALGRILAAPDMLMQAHLENDGAACPIVGDQERYELALLYYRGCKLLQDSANWPAGITFDRPAVEDPAKPSVYSPAWCGAEPVPPAAPPDTWRAAGGTIFTYSAGRLTGATVRKATVGALCNGSTVRVVVGSTTYMALDGGPATEATACKQAP